MKQELIVKKEHKCLYFPSKEFFSSVNFSDSRIYLTNKCPKKVDFPLCGILCDCKVSLLFVNVLSESCLLP